MDSLFLNKIAGAVLATVLFIVVLHILANEIFHPHIPAQTAIEVAVGDGGGATAKVEEAKPLPVLLAAGDADAGKKAAKKCVSCHTFDQGGTNKVGPNLYDIVGRDIAAVDGFKYSGAMQNAGGTWDYVRLDEFLADPKGALKGTKMTFKGVSKPEQRANLIFYLRSLSDSPVPLPQ